MENLLKIMEEYANKYMNAYISDLEIDKEILMDKDYQNEFYWIVRNSGTHMLSKENVQFKNSQENIVANCEVDNAINVFYITIEKRGTKNVYGNIKKIKKEDFRKIITEDTKVFKEKVIKIGFNNGTIIEGNFEGDNREILNKVVYDNKKDINDVKYFKILKYVS